MHWHFVTRIAVFVRVWTGIPRLRRFAPASRGKKLNRSKRIVRDSFCSTDCDKCCDNHANNKFTAKQTETHSAIAGEGAGGDGHPANSFTQP
jgi:hypothetical protein